MTIIDNSLSCRYQASYLSRIYFSVAKLAYDRNERCVGAGEMTHAIKLLGKSKFGLCRGTNLQPQVY